MSSDNETNVKIQKKKKYEIDMCSGPIVSKLLLFAGPLMLSSILQLLFNAADVVVVGKFAGDNSLAAVGSVGPVTNLCINLFMGLSIGSNVLASRCYGAKDEKRFSLTMHTAMLLSIIMGLILGLGGVLLSKQILIAMGSPREVIGLSTLYLQIYFMGIPAQSVYNFGSSILRATGDTKRPMYYLTFAGVVNVLLNLIFVIVLHMDVAGVATATIAAQYISAVLVVRCMIKEEGYLHLDLKKLAIDRYCLGKIVGIGLPASVQGVLFSVSNIIIQSSVNSFGAVVVAGNSAAGNLEGFVYVSMNTFYQTCMTFVGQNMGATRYDRINPIVVRSQILVITVGIALGNIMYQFGSPLLSIYTDSAAVIEQGLIRMRYIMVPYCLCGMMDVMVGAIRGLGYSVGPMIVTLIGACGTRLFWIFTFFQTPRFHEPKYLFLTYPISWALTFAAQLICFLIVRRKFDRETAIAQEKSKKRMEYTI